MNAISPVEAFRQQVLPPEKATDLFRSLPSHIKPAVFERNLVNALMQNPDLIAFNPRLVYREVSKAAALGLLLDPQLGEAYMVVAWNGRTKQKEPQLRVGYKGMCKLARQAGEVTNIYAHEVCQRDPIKCQLGTDKKLEHEPNLFTDRGDVVGYYAVIKFKDGTFDFEPMTVKQCRAIRDRSDAWKAFSENKIKSTPWATDEDEMSKKTVLRRLLKRQPQSPELAEAIRIEDEAEFPEMRNVTPRQSDDGPPPPPPAAIAHQPPTPKASEETPHDPVTGEIIESDAPPVGEPLPDADAIDEAQWLRDFEGALGGCEDMVSVGEQQSKIMLPMKAKVSAEVWRKAAKLVQDAAGRINQTILDAG